MRFGFVAAHSTSWPIRTLCRVLGVSASGFYVRRTSRFDAWRKRPDSAQRTASQQLLGDVRRLHAQHPGRYGSPRMHAALCAEGQTVSRGRIERVMRAAGLRATAARRPPVPARNHGKPSRPPGCPQPAGSRPWRLPRRESERSSLWQFVAAAPNQVWLADITCLHTGEGWLSLAAVLDLATRKVVGWSMREHLRAELTCAALMMAIQRQRPAPGLLHHSDRGGPYAADDYRKLLGAAGMRQSMSRRGNCLDNAPMESFFHMLKVELAHQCRWATRDEARRDVRLRRNLLQSPALPFRPRL